VARDKDISVMGGANIGQQYLAAGLVDEIQLHVAPVLFGSGTRMFEHLGDAHIRLEPLEVVGTPVATHMRFRVVK
jgi:dihydrofolate reductase